MHLRVLLVVCYACAFTTYARNSSSATAQDVGSLDSDRQRAEESDLQTVRALAEAWNRFVSPDAIVDFVARCAGSVAEQVDVDLTRVCNAAAAKLERIRRTKNVTLPELAASQVRPFVRGVVDGVGAKPGTFRDLGNDVGGRVSAAGTWVRDAVKIGLRNSGEKFMNQAGSIVMGATVVTGVGAIARDVIRAYLARRAQYRHQQYEKARNKLLLKGGGALVLATSIGAPIVSYIVENGKVARAEKIRKAAAAADALRRPPPMPSQASSLSVGLGIVVTVIGITLLR
ncbi:Uncharacterized protein PBTT_00302 [Plasmodiophora brassicae]|uniref:Uncharacterized protein n=1 Tax=Plasmodiophora brassicae TaxID=37360 RepID=A0A0G4IL23_PLABS|nr:hypothetical protein PBRA_004641 [Plasmodiophora brassicae]SPQ93499.1 unnamed protein product [Plasmodiophora brassicae]